MTAITRHFKRIFFAASVFAALLVSVPAMGQGDGAFSSEARRQARLFDEHIVRPGETAFSIARGYGLSLATLIEDNPGIDPARLKVGQALLIRKRERGRTSPAEVARQWEELSGVTGPDDLPPIVDPWGTEREGQGTEGQEAERYTRERGGDRDARESDSRESDTGMDARFEEYSPRADGRIPEIAVMLPLEGSGTALRDVVDLYRGALLALEDIKVEGHSVNVTLYNSARSADKVASIVSSSDFSDTDLIIGPVFEDEAAPAVRYAELFDIPIVSPLSTASGIESDVLYRMAPDPSSKYDKLVDLFGDRRDGGSNDSSSGVGGFDGRSNGFGGGEKNIILLSSGAGDDKEFEREITERLGSGNYGRFTIGGGSIASLIDWERENVFVVLAGNQLAVDGALTAISSSYNNASARNSRRADIKVLGSSKWASYNNIDRNLFFALNVRFVTSYYVDHADGATAHLEARYVGAYGEFPSRAAFRGYDTMRIFAGALFMPGYSFEEKLSELLFEIEGTPLDTSYRFVRQWDDGSRVNDRWTLVSFDSNFNVTIQ